jgi:hypothetical protein
MSSDADTKPKREKYGPSDDRFIAGRNAAIRYILAHIIPRMLKALEKLIRE